MTVSVHGLSPSLAAAVTDAFQAAGDGTGEAAGAAVVGALLPSGPDLLRLEQASWEGAIGVAREAFFSLQQAARSLVEQGGGCLVMLVPAHSLRTSRGCGAAAVVGSFLTTTAQVAAVELGPEGVRVNVLAVGPLEGEVDPRTTESIPLGRLTREADIAAACVMLAGPQAGFLSGTVIAVDGGYAVTKGVGGSPFAAADA